MSGADATDARGPGSATDAPVFCPSCDYSWEGLPAHGHCPECGLPYDEETIVLRGSPYLWRSPWLIVGLALIWSSQMLQSVLVGWGLLPALAGVGIVAWHVLRVRRMRRFGGLYRLLIDRGGVARRDGPGAIARMPWCDVRRVDVRPIFQWRLTWTRRTPATTLVAAQDVDAPPPMAATVGSPGADGVRGPHRCYAVTVELAPTEAEALRRRLAAIARAHGTDVTLGWEAGEQEKSPASL